MKNSYPFLRDPRAISEIRKHQWIESQKAGKEIGFSSAAVDWINRYGPAWHDAHAKGLRDRNFFLEQRKYRRFHLQSNVTLISGEEKFVVRSIDVSMQGMLCRAPARIAPGTPIAIRWSFGFSDPQCLEYTGTVARVSEAKGGRGEYVLLVKFNRDSQLQIENFSFLNTR